MKRSKRIKIALIVLGVVFLIINILWGINYLSYSKYTVNYSGSVVKTKI